MDFLDTGGLLARELLGFLEGTELFLRDELVRLENFIGAIRVMKQGGFQFV